jgi:Tfp pilus assembly protein PilX
MMAARLCDQRGVAALTVLLITGVMAVAGSVVAFSATAELEIGARDRRSEDAFSAAEAGLDQASAHFLRNPTWVSGQTAECLNNPLVDDASEYRDPATDLVCGVRITSPSGGQFNRTGTGKPFIVYTAVSRASDAAGVARTVAGGYRIEAQAIPFGMFINGTVDLNGAPTLTRLSLLVNGPVTSRNNLSTDANGNGQFDDPDLGWDFHKDVLRSNPAPDLCTDTSSGRQVGCAAVYSNFQIFSKNQERNSDEIHVSSPSPFPRDRDVHQTLVVNNEPQPVVNIPVDHILEPMRGLKQLAEAQGLFLNYRNGTNEIVQIQPADLRTATREFEKNVVVYIDADAGDRIGWKVSLIPGSTTSDIRYTNDAGQRVGSLSGVLVLRGGALQLESNTSWSGALFAPEGTIRVLGGSSCTCTMFSQGFVAQGGNSTIQLTADWFTRMPAGLVSISRTTFQECEPFQASGVCPPS